MTITIFCANCQADTKQEGRVEKGSLVTRCGCGRELKWPMAPIEDLRVLFQKHKSANSGQRPLTKEQLAAADEQRKKEGEFLAGLASLS